MTNFNLLDTIGENVGVVALNENTRKLKEASQRATA